MIVLPPPLSDLSLSICMLSPNSPSSRMKVPWKGKWQWPSCHNHPKTFSCRLQDDIFKTVNSVFFDPNDGLETPDSWFTHSSLSSLDNSTTSTTDGDSLENVIRGARSEHRLFFDPEIGHEKNTSSIIPSSNNNKSCNEEDPLLFKESVVMAMESENPYLDFKKSMEEMVEIHGLKDWKCFEDLLGWYLRMNVKEHHAFIVEAFVDLLVGHHNHHDSTTSYCSAASSSFSSSSTSSRSHRQLFLLEKI